MKDTLLIDLGNTNIKVAVKSEDSFTNLEVFESKDLDAFKAYLTDRELKRVVMLSVAPRSEQSIRTVLRELYGEVKIERVGDELVIPMVSHYNREANLGQDRLLNAYFIKNCIGCPALSIDMGSAITADLISSGGEFKGGLIFPGLKSLSKALQERTELLPEADLNPLPQSCYGTNTEDSIRLGIFTAISSLIERVIENYKKIEGKNLSIVLTGGDAGYLFKKLDLDFIYLPYLTIDALSLLSS